MYAHTAAVIIMFPKQNKNHDSLLLYQFKGAVILVTFLWQCKLFYYRHCSRRTSQRGIVYRKRPQVLLLFFIHNHFNSILKTINMKQNNMPCFYFCQDSDNDNDYAYKLSNLILFWTYRSLYEHVSNDSVVHRSCVILVA